MKTLKGVVLLVILGAMLLLPSSAKAEVTEDQGVWCKQHVVRQGDTIIGLSRKFGVVTSCWKRGSQSIPNGLIYIGETLTCCVSPGVSPPTPRAKDGITSLACGRFSDIAVGSTVQTNPQYWYDWAGPVNPKGNAAATAPRLIKEVYAGYYGCIHKVTQTWKVWVYDFWGKLVEEQKSYTIRMPEEGIHKVY